MTLPNMTKENQRELKALEKTRSRLIRERNKALLARKKAVAAIDRSTNRQIKGLTREQTVIERRCDILTGRLS